ncbi:MAG: hypothetical protein ACRC6U_08895, partial [Fusobacteriaceae bacterium]
MKNLASVEKFLKRCFKEKVTVTTATMVAFLITGSVGYGASYKRIISGEEITIAGDEFVTNENSTGLLLDGTLNITESPTSITNQTIVTNRGTISQKNNGKAIAAVNIGNAADFINEGTVSVNGNNKIVGYAISQTLGGLNHGDFIDSSSSIKNGEHGIIEVKNLTYASGIGAEGYKKYDGDNTYGNNVGKINILIENSGEIKIHSLIDKNIPKLALAHFNKSKNYKFKVGSLEARGSLGAGIVAGNLVSVANKGNIDIANENPMVITGTLQNGEIVNPKIGGVGIASAHNITKSKDGKTRVNISNDKSGTINMNGNYMMGIAAVGGVDVNNSGSVNITGDNSVGIILSEGATLVNSGTIKASGKDSFAIKSVGEIDDTLNLQKGSHIEGIIDLASGNDTINIDGVGDGTNQESLTLKNIENMSITNSNILLTKETNLKLQTSSTIISSNIVNEGNISVLEGKENIYVLNAQQGKTTIENRGVITATKGGSGVVIGGNDSRVINKGEINVQDEISSDKSWTTKGVNIINNSQFINEGTVTVKSSGINGEGARIYAGKIENTSTGKIILEAEKSKGIL